MNGLWIMLDLLLCLGMVALAWRLLSVADLFQAVVLFIVFGILVALAWVRLAAPDVALAEVAIGSGLTGALFLAALAHLRRRSRGGGAPPGRSLASRRPVWQVPHAALLVFWLLAPALLLAVLALPSIESGLAPEVLANLDQTGVTHPVTAVLLNYRAWDTLLELAVVMLVVAAALSLPDESNLPMKSVQGPVLAGSIGLLVPLLVLVAGYLLWLGAHAPGGAFQAGAVLAAGLVLLRLSGRDPVAGVAMAARRWLAVIGVLGFLLLGLAVTLAGLPFLGWPTAWAGVIILLIEVLASLSIAVALAALFGGSGVLRT